MICTLCCCNSTLKRINKYLMQTTLFIILLWWLVLSPLFYRNDNFRPIEVSVNRTCAQFTD